MALKVGGDKRKTKKKTKTNKKETRQTKTKKQRKNKENKKKQKDSQFIVQADRLVSMTEIFDDIHRVYKTGSYWLPKAITVCGKKIVSFMLVRSGATPPPPHLVLPHIW